MVVYGFCHAIADVVVGTVAHRLDQDHAGRAAADQGELGLAIGAPDKDRRAGNRLAVGVDTAQSRVVIGQRCRVGNDTQLQIPRRGN